MNDKLYFDPEDDEADGHGWNVVDEANDGAIAARYRDKAIALVAMLDNEDEALNVIIAIERQFGFTGTTFTRADAETEWQNQQYDPKTGETPEIAMPDDAWERIRLTWAWRKGIREITTECGWSLVSEAVAEALNED